MTRLIYRWRGAGDDMGTTTLLHRSSATSPAQFVRRIRSRAHERNTRVPSPARTRPADQKQRPGGRREGRTNHRAPFARSVPPPGRDRFPSQTPARHRPTARAPDRKMREKLPNRSDRAGKFPQRGVMPRGRAVARCVSGGTVRFTMSRPVPALTRRATFPRVPCIPWAPTQRSMMLPSGSRSELHIFSS